jgi:hypothetical protein
MPQFPWSLLLNYYMTFYNGGWRVVIKLTMEKGYQNQTWGLKLNFSADKVILKRRGSKTQIVSRENDDRPTRLWTHRGVRLWTHHDYGHTIFSRLWTHLLFSNTLSLFIIILFEFEFFYKLNKKNTTTTTKFIFLHESAKR